MKIDELKNNLKQFISYFCVGGTAALVEWGTFYLFSNVFGIFYQLATVLSFIFSTTVNWILGRMFTFKGSEYKGHEAKEMMLVFLVSLIGLGINMALMWLFVSVFGLSSGLQKLASKIMATGIVFFWNFLSRKLLIYKN